MSPAEGVPSPRSSWRECPRPAARAGCRGWRRGRRRGGHAAAAGPVGTVTGDDGVEPDSGLVPVVGIVTGICGGGIDGDDGFDDPRPYLTRSGINRLAIGDPSPSTMLYPVAALNPLYPDVISWKSLSGRLYRACKACVGFPAPFNVLPPAATRP